MSPLGQPGGNVVQKQPAFRSLSVPASYAIDVPSVEIACIFGLGLRICPLVIFAFIPRRARRNSCVEIFVKSQFVVVHLGRLQESADLHGTLALLLLGLAGRQLAFLGEELGIVA